MTWFVVTLLVLASIASLRRAYTLGVRQGRWDQALDDRLDIEEAVIAKGRAEQLAALWENRAKALLIAHFGRGKP